MGVPSIVIMVPARSGSKRVENKNLRLLSGKPMLQYVLEAVQDLPHKVYMNSDSQDILDFAKEFNAIPYKREASLASDTATNDEFAIDFMDQIESTYLVQVLPTSPFISSNEIEEFINQLISSGADTLISVKNEKIGCVYKSEPINFSKTKKNPPSQEMDPIQVYATSLMGWKVEKFRENYATYGCGYHGGSGDTQYFPLSGFSKIDIDTEGDFQLAETIAQYIPFKDLYRPFYYKKSKIDYIVPRVLKDDGVETKSEFKENQPVTNVPELMKKMPLDKSWYHTLVNTENNSCTIVTQMKGEGNRKHYHAKWNEWWYITQGEWLFEISGKEYIVKPGDLVFIEKGNKHCITATAEGLSSRLAVSRYDVEHIYEGSDD